MTMSASWKCASTIVIECLSLERGEVPKLWYPVEPELTDSPWSQTLKPSHSEASCTRRRRARIWKSPQRRKSQDSRGHRKTSPCLRWKPSDVPWPMLGTLVRERGNRAKSFTGSIAALKVNWVFKRKYSRELSACITWLHKYLAVWW